MFVMWLLIASLAIATILFLFGWLWHSEFMFAKVIKNISANGETKRHKSVGKKLCIEYVVCFILATGSVLIFAPYNWLFGAINGAVIGISIVLPFSISDSLWQPEGNWKMFLIHFFHKFLAVIIAFTLSGVFNSLIIPSLISSAS